MAKADSITSAHSAQSQIKMGKNINELPSASTLDGTELMEVLQGGVNSQTTAQDIANLGGGASYLKYVALLLQTGTDDPVATIFENTLGGEPTLSLDGTGTFSGTLAGAFKAGKSYIQTTLNSDLSAGYIITAEFPDEDSFVLIQRGVNASPVNIAGVYIEIRVYP